MAEAFIPGPFEYVLREDRDKKDDAPDKTEFDLQTLDEQEHAQIDDAMDFTASDLEKMKQILKTDEKGGRGRTIKVNAKSGSRALSVLRIGLKGWRKFVSRGKPVEFVKPGGDGMCPWQNILILQPKHRSEISAAIESGNAITEDEAKN